MRSVAQARLKRVTALGLAAEGHSYDDIAHEVGYRHRGSAHRAVFKALEEQQVEAADTFREVELQRLDDLQAQVWERALTGDIVAINTALRIIETRIKVLGLGSHPRPSADGEEHLQPLVRPDAMGG